MTHEELVEKIMSGYMPPLIWYNDPYWKRYGSYFLGIAEGYNFKKEKLETATTEELYEILIKINDYWLEEYKQWYNENEQKLQKVYNFGREMRKTINYTDKGYESNFDLLEIALEIVKNNFKQG